MMDPTIGINEHDACDRQRDSHDIVTCENNN